MKLHVLGCGDAFGSGGRNQSGYLVETKDRLFLLDCGPTTLLALKRAGFDSGRLDAILLSHLHGDHYGGVPFFLLDALHENPRTRPLHVAGPQGTEERVRGLLGLMFGNPSEERELPPTKFHLLQPDRQKSIEGIQVFPFRVPHHAQPVSLGLKISYGGKQILYSGDSAWSDLFITHSQGVDLFICESTFFEEAPPNHMSYKTIMENLPRLGCKNIILTHMGKEMLTRRDEVKINTAEDGMVVEV
jgi:ribonuclease BN (tRNA processing enzyme)